jgi:3-oxoadipate enol-lactonase
MPIAKLGSSNIHYETSGSGEPLLLIMGFATPGAAWIPTLPFLNGFSAIFYDNRGMGLSESLDGSYSVASMADDAVGLLDTLGIKSAKVFGVSMGGMIAQQIALAHPERVSKLVLGCTWAGGATAVRPPDDLVQRLIDAAKEMGSDPDHALDKFLPIVYPQEFLVYHPEIKTLMMLALAGMPPMKPDVVERMMAEVGRFDICDRLAEIKCPTLVIHGDQDQLIPPSNAQILSRHISQAELWIIPGAGHAFIGMDVPGVTHRISQWLMRS